INKNRILKYALTSFLVFCTLTSIFLIYMNFELFNEIFGEDISSLVLYFVNNLDGINDSSILTRISLLEKAQNAFEQRPIIGWGLDSFSTVFNNNEYYSHN